MSNRKIVNLEDFADELGTWAKASLKAKRKAVINGVARSLPMLAAESPVDTGMYAASWDMHIDELSVVVGNYAPYAGVIEYGARPHKPPLGPLLEWAKRVTRSSSQPPKYESKVWALAISVQKKITEQGQAPQHIMENMIPKIIENIRQELKRI